MQVCKYMSEMVSITPVINFSFSTKDLLNVEYNLTKAKKAHIKITAEKNCSVCHRRIGDKGINNNLTTCSSDIYNSYKCLWFIQME